MKLSNIMLMMIMVGLLAIPVAAEEQKNYIVDSWAITVNTTPVQNNLSFVPTPVPTPIPGHGYLIVYIRAGGSAQDLRIWIKNDLTNTTPFDSTYRPDRSEIEGQNDGYIQIYVLPDGVSEPTLLEEGNYTAYLQHGNADQMEMTTFHIGSNALTRITFLGSAVSSRHDDRFVFTVVSALYEFSGPGGCHWVHHEAVTHNVTIVDKPAWNETIIDTAPWDEYIYHQEINHTVYYPEVNHTVYHPEINHTVYHENTTSQVWVPEVNHTEKRASTWNETKPAIPATGVLADYEVGHVHAVWVMNCPVDAECFIVDHVWNKYRVTSDESAQAFVITVHAPFGSAGIGREADYLAGHVHARDNGNPSQTDFFYNNVPYHITGNKHDTAFRVTPGTPAEYGCVAGEWVDGTCPVSDPKCIEEPKCGCEQRIIVDTAGYFKTVDNMDGYEETVIDRAAYTEIIVDMEAHSEIILDKAAWTETIHHPAGSHEVSHPAITHEETVVDQGAWDEYVCTGQQSRGSIDVTKEVQQLVGKGRLIFTFNKDIRMLLKEKSDVPYVPYGGTITVRYLLSSQCVCRKQMEIVTSDEGSINLALGRPATWNNNVALLGAC